MTVTTRPLSELEIGTLSMRLKRAGSLRFPIAIGLVGWGLSLYGTLEVLSIFFITIPPVESLRWIFVLISLFWLAVIIVLGQMPTKAQADYRKRCLQDVEDGVMEIRTFLATEALQVAEVGDEGGQYFVRLADGQVLFLVGPYLSEAEMAGKFPCTEFDIILAPHSATIFGIDCRGAYFPPAKELKPFREKSPESLELVQVPWEEIEAKYC